MKIKSQLTSSCHAHRRAGYGVSDYSKPREMGLAIFSVAYEPASPMAAAMPMMAQYGGSLDEGELWELAASEEFRRLDLRRAEGAGVSRDAFCLMMLVRTEKLDAADLKRCQGAFDALDADGSGELDMADVQAAREAAAGGGAGGSA